MNPSPPSSIFLPTDADVNQSVGWVFPESVEVVHGIEERAGHGYSSQPTEPDSSGPAAPQTPLEQFVDTTFPPFGVLRIPESERREPTPADFADPRFDVVWELVKRLDVDFGNGLRSGATGNDVCAILDRLSRASSPSPSAALREQAEPQLNRFLNNMTEIVSPLALNEREAHALNLLAIKALFKELLGSTESP